MEKSLLALACLTAFAGATQAASVKVYGRLDAGLTSISGVSSSDETLTGLAYGPLSSSRWGIKGIESLVGGYKAFFALESEVHSDSGLSGGNNKTGSDIGDVYWKRKSIIGMDTPAGKFTLGLNKTIDKILASKYDMVGSNFAGFKTMSDYIAIGDRIDNAIFYESPKLGTGGKIYFERMFGEIAGEKEANTRTGLAATFKFGDVKGFVAYSEAKGALGANDWDQYGFGVQYKTPQKIVLKAQYWDLSNDSSADSSGLGFSADGEGYSISAMGPISNYTKIGLGYHHSEQTNISTEQISITQLVILHSFSKKITGYVMAGTLDNGSGANHELHKKGLSSQAGKGVDQNGFTIGMRVKF
jgi:predicted porin